MVSSSDSSIEIAVLSCPPVLAPLALALLASASALACALAAAALAFLSLLFVLAVSLGFIRVV